MIALGVMAAAWAADTTVKEPAAKPAPEATDAPKPAGEPKIVLDKMVYDFGTTSLVSQLSGVFVISNGGDAPLDLKKPSTSCGCTVAALKTDKLAPGEKTDLSFTMNVGNVPRGHAEKRITVPSNDPKSPSVVLTVKAEIVSIYDYSPVNFNLENIHMGTTTNVVITVKRSDGKALGITRVDLNGNLPNVHPKLEISSTSSNEAKILVEVNGDGQARRFAGSIASYTGDSKVALFAVPISGRIIGDVVLDQETLFWAIVDPSNWPGQQGANIATKRVKVTSGLSDQKLELSNPISTVPEMKVSIETLEDGKSYTIVATVPKSPKEIARGSIKVDTNFKSQPSIEIPVTVNVMKHD